MRMLILSALIAVAMGTYAQFNEFTGRYNYAFIEDSSSLVPLQGNYTIEYLARGQLWSYMDPRTPVNYHGERMILKSLFDINGAPLMVAEVRKDYSTSDQKLRVVRGDDTLIVDLGRSHVEERMLNRTAILRTPPRPPVLLQFHKGRFDLEALLEETSNVELTERFDALWKSHRTEVLELYDTARYEFSLMAEYQRVGPLEIPIVRDPHYATHLLHFPTSGPGTHFELYRQDSLAVTDTTMSLSVEMPPNGETGRWVDVTDLRYGKYTTYLKWGKEQSLFYLIFGW